MKKFKHKIIVLMLFVAFIGSLFIPLNGLGYYNYDNSNLNQTNTFDLDLLPSSQSKDLDFVNLNSESYIGEAFSIFDNSLKNYLQNFYLKKQNDLQKVKVIIHFEDKISKDERLNIIDSIFNYYEIINNYDIISAIYLKLNAYELIEKEDVLKDFKTIQRISKSEIYQSPYIMEVSPQISDLSKDSYPNWWLSAIGAEDLPYDGSGVRVAVIDTGIYDHPDLNIVENRNFVTDESSLNYNDDVGHGTHVGGIIGGNGGGSSGKYKGVAPGVMLINARAGNASGLAGGDIISAIQWCSKPIGEGGAGADIISMSFGGGYPIISDSITQAISNAKKNYGVIFVASAGNSGPEYFTGSTPASGIDVISVGATDVNNKLAYFSSWGPTFNYLNYPDVVAPGVDIISTNAEDSIISKEMLYIGDYFDFSGDADYIPLSGTSMSCPVVSGALAVLLDAFPNLTPESARIALLEGAKKLSNEEEDDFLKSGVGLINVSASLEYLNGLETDYNNISKIYPDNIPIKPYDLLHFPGDHQKFNLTVISGKNNSFNIDIPSVIDGVSLSLDKSTINFTNSGIDFIELDIKINENAIPGIRNFQLNLTNGSVIYDTVNVSLDIRLPEHNILMESYHGLNDWFPNASFYQMGFYEAIADLSDLNISIDYGMEHWTPNYNKDMNNSLLTEERLAQYDLVILQNPVLPYSMLEIENLNNYFDDGGNLLFLGTRYQDLILENINDLFTKLGIDIQINEENVMNDNWLGIGTTLSSQDVTNFNNTLIFKDVNKFIWEYGNTFNLGINAESIASIDGKTVVAIHNGSDTGRFIAFGDLHWIFDEYKLSNYSQDHQNLLINIMDYFFSEEEVSINIGMNSERTSNSQINLTMYLKNQTSGSPITYSDYSSLTMRVKNDSYFGDIALNTSLEEYGIYFNYSFNLPSPSYVPYTIEVNVTIGSTIYSKSSKILFYETNKVPKINYLMTDVKEITRANFQSITLTAELDKSTYGDIEGYLTIYPDSFYNTKQSINKTLTFSNVLSTNLYRVTYDPEPTDPSGYAVFYILPTNSNYTNPISPRQAFEIVNNPPEFLESRSSFSYEGGGTVTFDETHIGMGSYVYSVNQGTKFNFEIAVSDSVNYEDDNADMRIFVNLFICSVTEDGFIIVIFPSSIVVSEINYQSTSDIHVGSFKIPNTMEYNSIAGTKSKSTAASFDMNTNEGYLGILLITVYDSEGGYEEFIIILKISEEPVDIFIIVLIVIALVAVAVIVLLGIYFTRRNKYKRISRPEDQEYYYRPSVEDRWKSYSADKTSEPIPSLTEKQKIKGIFCPFCGYHLEIPKKFCPNCGESLSFFVK
ncbi:MAG: S8 family serine peptidase [Promethearchaeota archaeon]